MRKEGRLNIIVALISHHTSGFFKCISQDIYIQRHTGVLGGNNMLLDQNWVTQGAHFLEACHLKNKQSSNTIPKKRFKKLLIQNFAIEQRTIDFIHIP